MSHSEAPARSYFLSWLNIFLRPPSGNVGQGFPANVHLFLSWCLCVLRGCALVLRAWQYANECWDESYNNYSNVWLIIQRRHCQLFIGASDKVVLFFFFLFASKKFPCEIYQTPESEASFFLSSTKHQINSLQHSLDITADVMVSSKVSLMKWSQVVIEGLQSARLS